MYQAQFFKILYFEFLYSQLN